MKRGYQIPEHKTLVLVEWADAYSITDSWVDNTTIADDAVICKSAGWLLPNAKDGYVVIAQSENNADNYDGVLLVPVGMVLKVSVVS